jgi:hypothetical protein
MGVKMARLKSQKLMVCDWWLGPADLHYDALSLRFCGWPPRCITSPHESKTTFLSRGLLVLSLELLVVLDDAGVSVCQAGQVAEFLGL